MYHFSSLGDFITAPNSFQDTSSQMSALSGNRNHISQELVSGDSSHDLSYNTAKLTNSRTSPLTHPSYHRQQGNEISTEEFKYTNPNTFPNQSSVSYITLPGHGLDSPTYASPNRTRQTYDKPGTNDSRTGLNVGQSDPKYSANISDLQGPTSFIDSNSDPSFYHYNSNYPMNTSLENNKPFGAQDYLESLNSSSHSGNIQYAQNFPHPSPPNLSLRVGQTPHHAHVNSNPFDIIFDPLASNCQSRSPPPLSQTPSEHQFQYQAIEQNISNKTPLNDQNIYNQSNVKRRNIPHPIITIIDEKPPRRSGSVISRSASLKIRNSIRRRNVMVQKEDIEPKKGKARRKLNFIFPVKRKTSLKYSPVLKQSPNFNSDDELRAFLVECNAKELMKEFVPKQMNFYKHENILAMRPTLVSERKQVQISRTGSFNIKQVPKTISHPMALEEKPIKSPQHGRTISTLPFQEIVYLKYKNAVFANKFTLLPRFQEMFPNDTHLLSKAEVNQINKKLAFEVLIRRTVAAKIGYRLNQNRESLRASIIQVDSSASSSDSSSKPRKTPRNPTFDPRIPDLYKDSDSSNSNESINTEELIQQNASLFSELLPSPQISYTTDIFGSMYFENLQLSNKSDSKSNKSGSKSNKSGSKSNGKSSSLSHSPGQISTELLYVNDFNKAYFNKYKPKIGEIEGTLFNSNVYQLKPMTRSMVTFSSSDTSHGTPPINSTEISSSPEPPFSSSHEPPFPLKLVKNDKKNSPSSTDKSQRNSSHSESRKSQSTTHTSIFKHLEGFPSELSLYTNKDGRTAKDGSMAPIPCYNSPFNEPFVPLAHEFNESHKPLVSPNLINPQETLSNSSYTPIERNFNTNKPKNQQPLTPHNQQSLTPLNTLNSSAPHNTLNSFSHPVYSPCNTPLLADPRLNPENKRHSFASLELHTTKVSPFNIILPTKASSGLDLLESFNISSPIEFIPHPDVQKQNIQHGNVDLKSMKGSIIGTSEWTGSVASHSLTRGKNIPSHKRKPQSFGSDLTIGRIDSNSTRSTDSSTRTDLNYSGTVRSDFSFVPLGTASPYRGR